VLRRRKIIILIAALLAALAAVGAMLLQRGNAPQAARLLPAADAYFYIDLTPLRTAGLFKNTPANLDPDYAQFVRDTGFQFERDLDQAAFAVHLPATADLADSRTPPETRYSEVFVGRFDGAKLAAYLRKTADSSLPYGRTIIYSIPLPGRTLRLAVLSKSMVASSNTESQFAIQEIIDRYTETFTGSGPDLLRRYYRHVPLASLAWAVARTASAGQQGNAKFVLPGGFDLFFPPDTIIVAAIRYLGSVQVRADAFTHTREDAQRVSDQLNAFLAIARTVEYRAQSGAVDPDLKAFFDSISITQFSDRAELNATIPPGFVKKLVSEPPVEAIGAAPTAAPEAKKSPTNTRRHKGRKKK
jgi:hypothetical protein